MKAKVREDKNGTSIIRMEMFDSISMFSFQNFSYTGRYVYAKGNRHTDTQTHTQQQTRALTKGKVSKADLHD